MKNDLKTTNNTLGTFSDLSDKEEQEKIDLIGKNILKRRSLALFMLNLSEFIRTKKI